MSDLSANTTQSESMVDSTTDSTTVQHSEENHRLVRDSVNYIVNSSWYWYSMIRDKTYETSDIAKYGFDQIENLAKMSQPMTEKFITANAAPVVDSIDNNLNKVVDTLQDTIKDMKKKVDVTKQQATEVATAALKPLHNSRHIISLPATWYTNVNEVFAPNVDLLQPLTLFTTVASKTYVQLYENALLAAESANTAAANVKVEYLDFLNSINSRLGKVWSSSFVIASSTAFSQLQVKFAELSEKTPHNVETVRLLAQSLETRFLEYERSLVTAINDAFKVSFTSPSIALYNIALENYLQLTRHVGISTGEGNESSTVADADADVATESKTSQENVDSTSTSTRPSLTSFLENMKTKLGDSYAQLEAPLVAFHTRMSQVCDNELSRLTSLASSYKISQAGQLCLHDVYFHSKSFLESFSSYLNKKYSGLVNQTSNFVNYMLPSDVDATTNVDADTQAKSSEAEAASNNADQQSLTDVSKMITSRLRSRLHRRLSPIYSYRDQKIQSSLSSLRGVGKYTHSKARQLAGENIVLRAELALQEVEAMTRQIHDRTNSAVSSMSNLYNERFEQSLQQAKSSILELKTALEQTSTVSQAKNIADSYRPSMMDLKERIDKAVSASQDLISASAHYALKREFQAIPIDALTFVSAGIPKLFQSTEAEGNKTADMTDNDASTASSESTETDSLVRDVENTAVAAGVLRVHGLVEALKDVLYWTPKATVTEKSETETDVTATTTATTPVESESESESDAAHQAETAVAVVESEIQTALEKGEDTDSSDIEDAQTDVADVDAEDQ